MYQDSEENKLYIIYWVWQIYRTHIKIIQIILYECKRWYAQETVSKLRGKSLVFNKLILSSSLNPSSQQELTICGYRLQRLEHLWSVATGDASTSQSYRNKCVELLRTPQHLLYVVLSDLYDIIVVFPRLYILSVVLAALQRWLYCCCHPCWGYLRPNTKL